ncbi:MAG: DNA gyrase inhibitor YacG [Thermohalobaculum sp.]|nr:DNA gyrase inhibitor YacG [Thermohalobaculum sp.]
MCGAPARADWRPFCSRRCADVDLGRWFTGRYAIAGEAVSDTGEGAIGPDSDNTDASGA